MKRYYIAIADVHGDAPVLEKKLNDCDNWIASKRKDGSIAVGDSVQFVFMGDYIDRTPYHIRVLELVKERVDAGEGIHLIGNHDMMFIGAADGTWVTFHDEKTYGDKPRQESNLNLWYFNEGIVTCRDMFGMKYDDNMIPAMSIKNYLDDIRNSWMYEFLKQGKLFHETQQIFFSHAPQSDPKNMTDTSLIWGVRQDYRDSRGENIFKVPNNKIISVHGHMNMAGEKITFPRITCFKHGSQWKTVVMADCGCGSRKNGELHPVILRECNISDGEESNTVDIVAIL